MNVKEVFDYRDGQLYWRTSEHGREVNSLVGKVCGSGYVQVGVYKKSHKVHRLVWMWHHGAIPKGMQPKPTTSLATSYMASLDVRI